MSYKQYSVTYAVRARSRGALIADAGLRGLPEAMAPLKTKPGVVIENRLAELRLKRGIPAAALAKMAGVSRQTIYAIEAGGFTPNTAAALRLARALEAGVEELFRLPDVAPAPPEPLSEEALPLPGGEPPEPGQPVQLCRVDRRLIAVGPSPAPWYLPLSHGVVTRQTAAAGRPAKAMVQLLDDAGDPASRILVAGCDPAMSLLERALLPAGVEVVLVHRNSSQALQLLKDGCVHIAGTHLRDQASGESNLPTVRRMFAKGAAAVISFSIWEEGIVLPRGNPKGIRAIACLARPDVEIVNRESGAGSRLLLDAELNRAGIATRGIRGYGRLAAGHLQAAWEVHRRAADCCIATRAAAKVFGLEFLPLASERYDLVIRRKHLQLRAIQTLLDTLNRSRFRRELELLGGYDTRGAGARMM